MKRKKNRAAATKAEIEGEDYVVCQICGGEYKNLTSHLVKFHQVPTEEYKREFEVEFLMCRNVRRQQSRRQVGPSKYVPLNKSELIDRIRKLAAESNHLTRSELEERGEGYLIRLAEKHFGGLNGVLTQAGLEVTERESWSRQRIIDKICHRKARGESLAPTDMLGDAMALIGAAKREFGNWSNALTAAGIEPRKYMKRSPRSDGDWAAEFSAWVERHGPLNAAGLRNTGYGRLYVAAIDRHGSLERAAQDLGLPFARQIAKPLSRTATLDRMKARMKEGKALNAGALRNEDSTLTNAIKRHFSSHDQCLVEIGCDPVKIRKQHRWTKERVEAGLRDWVKKYGTLQVSALRKTDHNLAWGAKQRFGSLEAAATKLGLPFKKRLPWTRERIESELKCWSDQHGPLHYTTLRQINENLAWAAKRHYGSLEAAAAEFGLPYRKGWEKAATKVDKA